MFALSGGEEIMTLAFFVFDTIPECDRRRDGRTSLLWLYKCLRFLLCYRAGIKLGHLQDRLG